MIELVPVDLEGSQPRPETSEPVEQKTVARLLFPRIENAKRLITAITQEGTRVFIDWNVDTPDFVVDSLDLNADGPNFAVFVQDPRDKEPRLVGRLKYEPLS